MDWLRYLYDDWLTPASVVLGLVVTVPIFWTWWELIFGRRRRYRSWWKQIQKEPGERPAILIVDLNRRGDITAQVENFRQGHDLLRTIPAERTETISWQKDLTGEDMGAFYSELLPKIEKLTLTGMTNLHWFHSGPFPTAGMVGAVLANGCRVTMWQWSPQTGTYESFGPLTHPLAVSRL